MTRILSIDASTEACSVALLNQGEKTQRYQIAPQQHAKLLLPMVDELLTESALSLNQLDAIACHVGPGAFTGIRIAVSAAQGLAYGANLPTIAISSLTNMALMGFAKTGKPHWLCAIDARMQEVYFSAVSVNASNEVTLAYFSESQEKAKEIVSPAEAIDFERVDFGTVDFESNGFERKDDNTNNAALIDNIGLVGSGWQAYESAFFEQKSLNSTKISHQALNKTHLIEDLYPQAQYSLDYAEALFKKNQWLKPEELQPVYVRNPVFKRKDQSS